MGTTVANAFCYFGATVSSRTRDCILHDLTKDLLVAQKNLLRSCTALIFVYDKYQKGQQLKFQHGAHSSSFLKGTHEIVHKAHLWIDTTLNDRFVALTHTANQPYPSPYHMYAYETINEKQYGHFLAYDKEVSPADLLDTRPDFSGKRVESYIKLRDTATWINHVHRVFGKRERDVEFYRNCPASIDRQKLVTFNRKCRTTTAKKLFAGSKTFQKDAVRQWNPYVDEITKSCLLGVLGIDESDSNGCGAVLLDFLFRVGIMYQNEEDASWEVADDHESRRMYVFGDAKSIENQNKFIRDFHGRRLSYDKANLQAEKFMKATKVVMELPGDWHSGMNMCQSLFNIYYDGFLEPFQKVLGWKRISSDVRGCYFQASRLISFVSDVLIRFLYPLHRQYA